MALVQEVATYYHSYVIIENFTAVLKMIKAYLDKEVFSSSNYCRGLFRNSA